MVIFLYLVTFIQGKRLDGLPDWVWYEDGFEFQKMIPSCIDPTYCESDPPLPQINNVDYTQPPTGSLRFEDGEIIVYTCQDESEIKFKTYEIFFQFVYKPQGRFTLLYHFVFVILFLLLQASQDPTNSIHLKKYHQNFTTYKFYYSIYVSKHYFIKNFLVHSIKKFLCI